MEQNDGVTIWPKLSTEGKRAAKIVWNELKRIKPENDTELFMIEFWKSSMGVINLESNRSLRPKGTGNYTKCKDA